MSDPYQDYYTLHHQVYSDWNLQLLDVIEWESFVQVVWIDVVAVVVVADFETSDTANHFVVASVEVKSMDPSVDFAMVVAVGVAYYRYSNLLAYYYHW